MAVFEKNIQRKVCLDDTQVLRCSIVNTQNIQGHTEYIIRVNRQCSSDEKWWKVYKRYNDFVALHHQLQTSAIYLPLPPKKYINNFDQQFIAERQVALQKYLNIILMNPILASSLPLKKFLDPENYSIPFQELAVQHVSLALRADLEFEAVKPIPDIGWRIRKHYFQVRKTNVGSKEKDKEKDKEKEEYILSWCEYGPDKYVSDKDMHALFKSLSTLQHPHIYRIESCNCGETGAYVVRKYRPEGTLRDMICSTKPKLPFLKKYANPKHCNRLPPDQIILYSVQILNALLFLRDKGIPYGNLHAGNVMVEQSDRGGGRGAIKLLDIENGVLGVPSYYRPYFMQFRKISTLEAVDVYCFGHLLFEMLFGRQLQQPVCDNCIPDSCPVQFKSVLESILSSSACKSGVPGLDELANMPIFSSNPLDTHNRPHIKLSPHVKEILKQSCQKSLTRMEDEQRKIRHQKRLVKMQAVLSAEGEHRKSASCDKKKHKLKMNGEKSSLERSNEITNGDHNGEVKGGGGVTGGSGERSDSPNSTSTATSAGTLTPPTTTNAEVAPAPPPPPVSDGSAGVGDNKRTALLGSICSFDKSTLRTTNRQPPATTAATS